MCARADLARTHGVVVAVLAFVAVFGVVGLQTRFRPPLAELAIRSSAPLKAHGAASGGRSCGGAAVEVSVFLETLCPDSARFIVHDLAPPLFPDDLWQVVDARFVLWVRQAVPSRSLCCRERRCGPMQRDSDALSATGSRELGSSLAS